jgi:hypothetical protein
MDISVEKTKVMRTSRQSSPLHITLDEKQLENVEYFKDSCSVIKNDATFTH